MARAESVVLEIDGHSRLDGGACHVQVSGVGHNEMDNDAGIFAHVLAAVDGTCTGTFK